MTDTKSHKKALVASDEEINRNLDATDNVLHLNKKYQWPVSGRVLKCSLACGLLIGAIVMGNSCLKDEDLNEDPIIG